MTKRAKLLTILEELGTLHVGGPKLENVESVIDKIEALYRPSFSTIVKNGAAENTCPCCGHVKRIYRRVFRKTLLPGLTVMVNHPKVWTMREVADFLKYHRTMRAIEAAEDMASYGTELSLFGLIEKDGKGWKATELAGQFLCGDASVPTWVWPQDQNLPPSCVNGPLVSVEQIEPIDHSDKVMHARSAVAVTQNFGGDVGDKDNFLSYP